MSMPTAATRAVGALVAFRSIAISTLAVVALLQPLCRWIQAAVDRRFYRSRYDAQRTLDAFSACLRDEIGRGSLERELLAILRQTIQPPTASVGIRR